MILGRREFTTLLGAAIVGSPLAATGQQTRKIYRIGFLANDPSIPTTAAGKAFIEELQSRGFREGHNILIDWRFAEGRADRFAEFATMLVRLQMELIVTSSTAATWAAKQATQNIPIVMLNVRDPIDDGLVTNLAHPGGNITGLSNSASPEMAAKRLELLKQVIPGLSSVGVLIDPDIASDMAHWHVLEQAARSLGVALQGVPVRQGYELADAFAKMMKEPPQALYGLNQSLILTYRKKVVELAVQNRLPTIFAFTELAEAGGLISYGASRPDLFRRAAIYVSKILNGDKAGDLPVEQPTRFDLVINLKTAKSLGFEIPPTLLALADTVIE